MRQQFNQIAFQQKLIDRLIHIAINGVGDHRTRSARRARRNAVLELMAKGYAETEARRLVEDADDMAALELSADELESI